MAAIYQLTLRRTGPNWKAMNKPARANRDLWERDRRNALDRATHWQQVVADALAAEEAVRPDEA